MSRHTEGPWKVYETRIPHYLGNAHVERRIGTAWDHPQLKGPYPVVSTAVGVGEREGGPAVQFTSISAENAALISTAPELLDALRVACTRCACTVRERDSGHLLECPVPQWQELIERAAPSEAAS